MLAVVILICTLLVACNAFYSTNETEEKYGETNRNIKEIR